MKIIVTGAAGQLGRDFCQLANAAGHDIIALDRSKLDLEQDAETIASAIAKQRADWVVNCAAYTQVDKAESEAERAFAVNRDAAGAIARGVKEYGGKLLHVSTDFIFDGDQNVPYREEDTAGPLNIYGQSKHEGELAVLEACPNAVILRTAWVYGAHGHNFVKTILRLAAERDELSVVDDQYGTPSWTRDIAATMLTLIRYDAQGIYHYTNEGVASWYDFAVAIIEIASELDATLKAKTIKPIPTTAYPTPATRPAYSVLSKQKIRTMMQEPIPYWRHSLRQMLGELYP
jgi:dTDP-4-dehydrorhamnose reductase